MYKFYIVTVKGSKNSDMIYNARMFEPVNLFITGEVKDIADAEILPE